MRLLAAVNLRDGEAEHVIDGASHFAQIGGGQVDLLYAENARGWTSWATDPMVSMSLDIQLQQIAAADEQKLHALRERLPLSIRGEIYRELGKPAEVILDRSSGYDAIILTGRRHSTLSKVFVGSVAVRVVQAAERPVIILPARDRAAPLPATPSTGVFGVDLRAKDAGTGLDAVIPWAQRLKIRVDLVHVDPTHLHLPYVIDPEIRHQLEVEWSQFRRQDEQHIQDWLKKLPIEIRGRLRLLEGEPDIGLLEASEQADYIFVATHGRQGISRWTLGSVAEKLMQQTTRPLILLRA